MIEMTAEEFEVLTVEMARLERVNADLKAQVDWLLRERMDQKSLEIEARKHPRERVLMSVEPQGDVK